MLDPNFAFEPEFSVPTFIVIYDFRGSAIHSRPQQPQVTRVIIAAAQYISSFTYIIASLLTAHHQIVRYLATAQLAVIASLLRFAARHMLLNIESS